MPSVVSIPVADLEPTAGTNHENFILGVLLAVSSSIFIGSSFIVKKKGLLRLTSKGQARAGAGGFGYLKDWVWWAGLSLMGIGEATNFAAYAFAPASLVTPLGALSVLVTAILSSNFLQERLNILGKVGCFLCFLGSTVIVLHSPKEALINDLDSLAEMLVTPLFLTYSISVTAASFILIWVYAPKYGQTNVVYYVLICSLIGSLSVTSCKGLGIALTQTFNGQNELFHWVTILCFFSLIFCVSVQMNYLNKALDIFNTSIVTPIYYVFFTSFVLIASGILFDEFRMMSLIDIVGLLSGFLVVVSAIFLLNAFKDMDISLNNVDSAFSPRNKYRGVNSNGITYERIPSSAPFEYHSLTDKSEC